MVKSRENKKREGSKQIMKKRSTTQKRLRCDTPTVHIHRDILSHIYGFLSRRDELRVYLVCRHWGNVPPRSYCLTGTGVHYATVEAVSSIKEDDYMYSTICRSFPGSSSGSLWANLKHASAQMTNLNVKTLLRWARGMETLVLTGSKELTSSGLAMASWPATLIHLDLTLCHLISDLKFLAHLPNLRVLKVNEMHGIEHRGGYDALTTHCRALQVLEMTECRGLINLGFLRGHPALTSINIENAYELVDIFQSLATIGTLQRLKILGCDSISSSGVEDFMGHPNLKEIEFGIPSFVHALPTLMCLCTFHYYRCDSDLVDLNALSSHPTLRNVILSFDEDIDPFSSRELSFIRTLPNLVTFKITDGLPEDFDFLERHPSLRELSLEFGDVSGPNRFRSIGTIPHLEILEFNQVSFLNGLDLAFITNHGNLRRLELIICGHKSSSNLSALATCRKLQHLFIEDLWKITVNNLDFLRNNNSLLSLSVRSEFLESSHLRVLLSVPKLESLDVNFCNVNDISFLVGHSSLFHIYARKALEERKERSEQELSKKTSTYLTVATAIPKFF